MKIGEVFNKQMIGVVTQKIWPSRVFFLDLIKKLLKFRGATVLLILFIISNLFCSISFANKNSLELGLTFSNYRYAEPDLMDLRVRGVNFGIDVMGEIELDDYWFTRGNVIGAYGKVDYRSYNTGTSDSNPNWYIDTRALFGKKYNFYNSTLSPYVGLGYRFLYHDGRGVSSVGAKGYRRDSNYFYLPVGIEYALDISKKSKIITNIEFDYLIAGRQKSYLSDINSTNSDIENWQRHGYGARAGISYQFNNFSIGPYITYWFIKGSDKTMVGLIDEDGFPTGEGVFFMEPENYTLEAGLKISYRF